MSQASNVSIKASKYREARRVEPVSRRSKKKKLTKKNSEARRVEQECRCGAAAACACRATRPRCVARRRGAGGKI